MAAAEQDLSGLRGTGETQAFVWLWTFVRANLPAVNSTVSNREGHPFNLKSMAWDHPLTALTEAADLDLVTAAQWLKRLDLVLSDGSQRGDLTNTATSHFIGYDGQPYRLRLRNSWASTVAPSETEPPPSGAVLQGGIAAYARRVVPVPVPVDPAVSLREVALLAPVRRRLKARLVSDEPLTALLWATYPPSLAGVVVDDGTWFTVRPTPATALDDELRTDLTTALSHAREANATVLLLPELCCSAAALTGLAADLAKNGGPLLTVVGLFHEPVAGTELTTNEAVVLGPDGTELFRHRKTASFGASKKDGSAKGERLRLGDELTIMSTPLGNLCVAICVELFAQSLKPAILSSHASLVMAPSFSRQTGPHRAAASEFDASLGAATLCTNISAAGPAPRGGESFARFGGVTQQSVQAQQGFVVDLRVARR